MNHKLVILVAALSSFLATCLGAFGAHALKSSLSVEMLAIYQTGVSYQFYHSLALLLLGILSLTYQNNYLRLAGFMFVAGIVLFSGSLYMLAVTDIRAIGIITPIGGIAFLVGWLSLAYGIIVHDKC